MSELASLLKDGLEDGLFSAGVAAVGGPAGTEIAAVGTLAFDDPTPVTNDTLFDLASVTKTFTAAAILRLAETGIVELDAPVADVLRIGRGPGSADITLSMLLTHTAGLAAGSALWRDGTVDPPFRREDVLNVTLAYLPETRFHYSCLGYIAAVAVAEKAAGQPLHELIHDLVTAPLGLDSIQFGPCDPSRTAATEQQDYIGRGMLRGSVHDELCWYLGGRSGNAGLFGTAADVVRFAQSFLDGSLLSEESLHLMTTPALRPEHGADFQHSLGLRLDDRNLVGDSSGFGHAGFTGTSWFALPEQGIAAVLLTNRVHPRRDRVDLAEFRQRFAGVVGRS